MGQRNSNAFNPPTLGANSASFLYELASLRQVIVAMERNLIKFSIVSCKCNYEIYVGTLHGNYMRKSR